MYAIFAWSYRNCANIYRTQTRQLRESHYRKLGLAFTSASLTTHRCYLRLHPNITFLDRLIVRTGSRSEWRSHVMEAFLVAQASASDIPADCPFHRRRRHGNLRTRAS